MPCQHIINTIPAEPSKQCHTCIEGIECTVIIITVNLKTQTTHRVWISNNNKKVSKEQRTKKIWSIYFSDHTKKLNHEWLSPRRDHHDFFQAEWVDWVEIISAFACLWMKKSYYFQLLSCKSSLPQHLVLVREHTMWNVKTLRTMWNKSPLYFLAILFSCKVKKPLH
jgi:hypothetical protein